MKLPPFRKSVCLEFWSLRGSLGANYGYEEIDKKVQRMCYRQRVGDTWRWIIRGINRHPNDHLIKTDQISLGEIGDDMSDVSIIEDKPSPTYKGEDDG